ncbi:2-aminoethylphosphonate--pyruvate transaminase [Paralcaligenes ureilyticus]|uniref:2-aminoethylphosphonate--pyruvate transaminase n=1 Tax=Paralcaligenes ureilyticus TaxID=627131 RepID=A0A4R3M2P1_9BURK|nr:2-aminoethylphosphonate--pyruvate transaminase [Paralcaligenes ureilyticus]TCT07410.1 2-aminoethylphosphonate--pyruvate transaminase [Paralcaligenes ureilyticus]
MTHSTHSKPAASETGDPFLLTPGPLTTSRTVKAAMVHDWGSRDASFIAINKAVLTRLCEIANGGGDYVTVPMQGSGTFAVEAMLTSFVPPTGKVLVLINGAYGRRAKRILEIAGRETVVHETAEDTPPDLNEVEAILKATPSITHIFTIHCETTSGILNPIVQIGALAAKYRKGYLIDSMSAFGALPLDARALHVDALAASSNKCIEGVPGLGFVVCRRAALGACKGNATTLVLDLHDQWANFEKTGQYRFTPPIHVIVAFHQALEEFTAEGGVAGRGGRYQSNCRILLEGMTALGFKPLLAPHLQAPIIVTFHMMNHPRFIFQDFYDGLKDRGFIIYPGKLTVADSFRIGCIGRLGEKEMRGALAAVREVLQEMGVTDSATRAA